MTAVKSSNYGMLPVGLGAEYAPLPSPCTVPVTLVIRMSFPTSPYSHSIASQMKDFMLLITDWLFKHPVVRQVARDVSSLGDVPISADDVASAVVDHARDEIERCLLLFLSPRLSFCVAVSVSVAPTLCAMYPQTIPLPGPRLLLCRYMMTLLHPLVFAVFPEDVDADLDFATRAKGIQVCSSPPSYAIFSFRPALPPSCAAVSHI